MFKGNAVKSLSTVNEIYRLIDIVPTTTLYSVGYRLYYYNSDISNLKEHDMINLLILLGIWIDYR